MTKETAELNVGCFFTVSGRRCYVLKVDSFNGVLHYGFGTVDNLATIVGWIPVDLVGGCELTK